MTSRAKTLACVLFLTLFVVVLFADILFAGRGLFLLDLSGYHFPMKRIVRDTILAGEFPWWNRFYSGGQPMAANPAYEVFYPGQWPILIGSYRFGFNLHIILHVWVALIGMFLFLREDGAGFTAALIGALSFATGGYFYSLLVLLPTCFVWAWAPLAAFFLWRWRNRGESRWLACAAMPLGMQALVSEPVSLLQVWSLVALCLTADAARQRSARTLLRYSVAATVLAIAVIAIGAAQLLGAFDHIGDTSRRGGLPYREVVRFSTAPERAVELLYPHYFGSHRGAGPYYWGVGTTRGAPYFLNIYLGLIIAVGAVSALFSSPAEAIPVFLLAIAAYLAALGDHTPLFDAMYDLGIVTRFRYPEKFLSLMVLPLVWLGARTLDRFLMNDRRTRLAVLGTTAGLTAVTAALFAWSRTDAYRRWFLDHWSVPSRMETQSLVELSRGTWMTAIALSVALAALVWSRRLWRPAIWAAALVAFTIVDLLQVHDELAPRMPRKFFSPPGIVGALDRPADDYAIFHLADWALASLRSKDAAAGYADYWMRRNGLVPPTQASWGLRSALDPDYDETSLTPAREMFQAMLRRYLSGVPDWWQPFAAMSNVRYTLGNRDFDKVAAECRGHFEFSRPVTLRRFQGASPRYFFARELIEARRSDDVAGILQRRGTVPGVAFVPFRPFAPAPGRILRAAESPGTVRLDVDAAGTSYLVATITRHRYWRVTLDGRPIDVHATNIAYQGFVVPSGRHVVTMRYRNPFVTAGITISLFALSVIILVVARGTRWKSRGAISATAVAAHSLPDAEPPQPPTEIPESSGR